MTGQELSGKLIKQAETLISLADSINKGDIADYDITCVIGMASSLLERYNKRYTESRKEQGKNNL